MYDKTARFTGNFSVKADIFDWWWISYRMGIDKYTTDYSKRIQAGGVVKQDWQDGMMSDNTTRYDYINTNLMTNFNKSFGDFGFNLLAGMTTDNTKTISDYRMAYGFQVPDFFLMATLTKTIRNSSTTSTANASSVSTVSSVPTGRAQSS